MSELLLNTYLLCNSPWNRVRLDKLTVSGLVKKFPAFSGTRFFVTAFARNRHWCLLGARWLVHDLLYHFFKLHFNTYNHLLLGLPSGPFSYMFCHINPLCIGVAKFRIYEIKKSIFIQFNIIWLYNLKDDHKIQLFSYKIFSFGSFSSPLDSAARSDRSSYRQHPPPPTSVPLSVHYVPSRESHAPCSVSCSLFILYYFIWSSSK